MLNISKIARASEWWEYKLPPMLAVVYATSLSAGKNLYDIVPQVCILLLGIIIGAAYVSIVNDLTDIKEDEMAGKQNRLSRLPPSVRILLALLPVTGGFFFAYFFLHDALSIILYALCWISFSLYSIPPFRFKKRGFWGVLADASGAHFFPTLFLIAAVSSYVHVQVNWFWFCVTGIWSLMYGLRGILWHQFFDRDNDLKTGVQTYASKKNPLLFQRQSLLLITIELMALAFMLAFIFKPLPLLALIFYSVMLAGYNKILKLKIIAVITPAGRPWHFAMNSYYQLLFPLSLLLTSALVDPRICGLIAAHLILFPAITRNTIVDVFSFFKAAVKKIVL